MGGFFGAALREDVVFDLFYGTDYHSHLGTRRAGMAVYCSEKGFDRAIHNIENSNFRPKFEKDLTKMKGHLGIGCISDYEPQPLIVRSHHGTYAITTVGKINNIRELTDMLFSGTHSHFLEMSGGDINPTEMVASLINQKKDILEGIKYVQDMVEGSMTFLIMTPKGIYASRDKWGRTPCVIGKKDTGYCVCFESFSFLNLGYTPERELGPGEVIFIEPEGYEVMIPARKEMRICSFLWIIRNICFFAKILFPVFIACRITSSIFFQYSEFATAFTMTAACFSDTGIAEDRCYLAEYARLFSHSHAYVELARALF